MATKGSGFAWRRRRSRERMQWKQSEFRQSTNPIPVFAQRCSISGQEFPEHQLQCNPCEGSCNRSMIWIQPFFPPLLFRSFNYAQMKWNFINWLEQKKNYTDYRTHSPCTTFGAHKIDTRRIKQKVKTRCKYTKNLFTKNNWFVVKKFDEIQFRIMFLEFFFSIIFPDRHRTRFFYV